VGNCFLWAKQGGRGDARLLRGKHCLFYSLLLPQALKLLSFQLMPRNCGPLKCDVPLHLDFKPYILKN